VRKQFQARCICTAISFVTKALWCPCEINEHLGHEAIPQGKYLNNIYVGLHFIEEHIPTPVTLCTELDLCAFRTL